ncbi:MAG TPA: hypothetical protein VGF61_23735 [Candidatus Acidoferrum sp.]|jgi:hypothetical protein
MRTLFSFQWLLTTLGRLEAQRSAQEVVQQQHVAPQDGLADESSELEPVLTKKIYAAHKAKIAKTDQAEREIRDSSE